MTRVTWIENARLKNWKQRKDYRTGKFLRCPSRARDGNERQYRIMREPNIGDAVIHFREDDIWGVKPETRIVGSSYVKRRCETDDDGNFRINLRGFQEFEIPISVSQLIEVYGDEIRAEIEEDSPEYYPFARNLKFRQGGYLSRATPRLLELIRTFSDSVIDLGTEDADENLHIQKEYIEGIRRFREVRFFSRNPRLVKEVKAKAQNEGNLRCYVCKFDFEETYGDLGAGFIECHHLNPLSEREYHGEKGSPMTRSDEIRLLCSNCHRMVHRNRSSALDPDDLKKIIRSKSKEI